MKKHRVISRLFVPQPASRYIKNSPVLLENQSKTLVKESTYPIASFHKKSKFKNKPSKGSANITPPDKAGLKSGLKTLQKSFYANLGKSLAAGGVVVALAILYYFRDSLYNCFKEKLTNTQALSPNYIPTTGQLSDFKKTIEDRNEALKIIAITGLSGAGKSEFAKAYALDYYAEKYFFNPRLIVWTFDCQDPHTLRKQFEDFAEELNQHIIGNEKLKIQSPQSLSVEQLRNKVERVLKMCPGFLLIIDNVQKYADIKEYLPRLAFTQGQIIITTQDEQFFENSRQQHAGNRGLFLDGYNFNLQGMTNGQARKLLSKLIINEDRHAMLLTDDGVKNLNEMLRGMARYLLEAGIYINSHSNISSIDDYIQSVKYINVGPIGISSNSHKIFKRTLQSLFNLPTDVNQLDVSLQALLNQSVKPGSWYLLAFIQVLAAGYIPVQLIDSWLAHTQGANNWDIDSIRKKLMVYGLLNPTQDPDVVQLHHSVQWRFESLLHEFNQQQLLNATLQEALKFMATQVSGDSRTVKLLQYNAQLVAHAEHMLALVEKNDLKDLNSIKLLYSLGHHFMQRDDYPTAKRYLTTALDWLSKLNDKDSSEFKELAFKTYRYLGRLSLYTWADVDKARIYFQEAEKLSDGISSSSGKIDIDKLITISDYADLLLTFFPDEREIAETRLKTDVLKILESKPVTGDVDYERSRAYQRLAKLYLLQNDLPAAKQALDKGIPLFELSDERLKSEKDSFSRMVDIYLTQGDYYLKRYESNKSIDDLKEADDAFKFVLDRCNETERFIHDKTIVKKLHTNYRYKARAYAGLAEVAEKQDDYFSADESMEKAIQYMQDIHSANSIPLQKLRNLHQTLINKRIDKCYEEYEEIDQKIYEINKAL